MVLQKSFKKKLVPTHFVDTSGRAHNFFKAMKLQFERGLRISGRKNAQVYKFLIFSGGAKQLDNYQHIIILNQMGSSLSPLLFEGKDD